MFDFSLFLVLAQSVMHLVVTGAVMLVFASPPNQVPHQKYAQIGFSYMLAMFSSNWALSYVSFPTQVLGKSCKMIPVMLMRIIFVGKRYTLREYLAVILITAGIAIFLMGKGSTSGGDEHNSLFGIALLLFSLMMDGFTGPNQDAVLKQYKPSELQMAFWMNFYPVVLGLPVVLYTGEFMAATKFCTAHPEIIYEVLLFGFLSAVGQLLIVFTVFRFDSLVLTTITTTRKFFSIMASVIMYGHQLVPKQWAGVALVFGGLGLEMFNKYQEKKSARGKNN